ncbi:MAG: tyrosine-type recombinase/integrase [Firmicutes bacterium]|nr:tyrosine-type recombinase/integrase [Bacteroidales bacterium]MDD6979115.1 tyrosine-type recombinase/integrase [Bacillota bacterium]MDY6174252.1 tyrosine-type recombinase/integrase [Lentihominibacter sp.]
MVELLKEYKTEFYDKAKTIAGKAWPDNDFVFVNVYGQLIHPDAVSTWLVRLEKKYGLPHLNTHAFRYSVASALIYAGVNPISVSRRLGHAQVSTTTNVYAHMFKKADERNAEILESLF